MSEMTSSDSGTKALKTGVVVIGRNEGDRLLRCFDTVPKEVGLVVYVDSGSTDGSVAAAELRGIRIVELSRDTPFSAARARNAGFAALIAAAGDLDYVQFIDGDCELFPEWLPIAEAFLREHERVAVVCGRRYERSPGASIYNQLCNLEWDTPVGEAAACGGDALMRVHAFESAGGFNNSLMAGEEPELCARLRQSDWMIWRLDAAMTRHDAAIYRLGQWWLRGVRSGAGYLQAYLATRRLQQPLYQREIARSILWAGIMPLMVAAALFVSPWVSLAILLLYPIQIARTTLRHGIRSRFGWAYGVLMMLAKFAELRGILRYLVKLARGDSASGVDYKRVSR